MQILLVSAFVAGVWLLQQQSNLPSLSLLFWLVASVCLFIFVLSKFTQFPPQLKRLMMLLTVGLFGFFYAASFATFRLSDELPKAWEQKNIEVEGVVSSMAEHNAYGERFRFDVERVITSTALEQTVPKHITLNSYQKNTWRSTATIDSANLLSPSIFKAGQRWRFTVRLKRPHTTYNPNGYDFEAWALAQNIRGMGYIRNQNDMNKLADFVWRPRYMIEYCREKVSERITQALANQPYAGVIRALVVGDHSQISANEWDVYLRTGTNHLMSISGLHITMLAGLAFSLIAFCWRRFPRLVLIIPTRKAAVIGSVFVALLYACLAGLSVPTQRTLMMLTTFAVALLLNKRVPMSSVLTVALLLVVLLDPWAVIAPGFWLSFSAVAFIAYTVVNRLKIRHWLIAAVNTQWSVTLGLLPFLILMFGQASVISPVANELAIPIISLLVVPLAIIGALLPFDFVLHGAQQILEVCMIGLNWLASSPIATWQQVAPPTWTIALSILGVLWLMLPRGFPQRWLGGLLVLPMLLASPTQLAQGEMQVTVLDVGQGLSVAIKTATHSMVYDAGRKYNDENDAGSQIILPYLRSQGIKHLDAMVISHDDSDHSGGAASLLAQMPIGWVASSYMMLNGENFMAKQSTPKQSTPKQFKCYAGQQWVWDLVKFEVLYPQLPSYQDADIEDNNRSCVIKVTSRFGSLLLTGDIEAQAEQILLESKAEKLKTDVMIAPHHGSKTSSIEAFIQATAAKQVIFTVGYLNRFKHPKPEIINRYETNAATLYRSDHDGALIVDFMRESPLQINALRTVRRRYWHDDFL
jgi:competence protein ComEC